MNKEKAGFIAVVGRPNAGKSSLLNWLVDEKIAMVSKKSNATRKRANIIVMHENTQFIFIDTPGIHQKERLLNKFMMEETLRAIGDCDLILFLSPINDSIENYNKFLQINKSKKKHVVLLTKCDTVSNKYVLNKLKEYGSHSDDYEAIIPVSTKHVGDKIYLLKTLSNFIPFHPYLYDPELITTLMMRDIYKELIREAIFNFTSDEVPYSSDVQIDKVEELSNIENIYATIIVEKESQKSIMIGKNGATLKRIGTHSRFLIENLIDKKVFLKLLIIVNKNWTKNNKTLKKLGFN